MSKSLLVHAECLWIFEEEYKMKYKYTFQNYNLSNTEIIGFIAFNWITIP